MTRVELCNNPDCLNNSFFVYTETDNEDVVQYTCCKCGLTVAKDGYFRTES